MGLYLSLKPVTTLDSEIMISLLLIMIYSYKYLYARNKQRNHQHGHIFLSLLSEFNNQGLAIYWLILCVLMGNGTDEVKRIL
jgi:hypothetical protein